MEKININVAELLRNYPKGTELYSPIYGNGILIKVTDRIHVKFPKEHNVKCFRPDGRVSEDGEIMIFPKGKTTWEGFVPPCKFKDGDILYIYSANPWICIYKEGGEKENVYYKYVAITSSSFVYDCSPLCHRNNVKEIRHATEEEKQKIFKAIKDNGYKWNEETKTLGKLIEPQFKVGDRIKRKGDTRLTTIKDIKDNYYIITIPDYFDNAYITDKLSFSNQDEYELVPNKFDITTLKPFDKVLVRTKNFTPVWTIDFYDGYQPNIGGSFTPFGVTSGKYFQQCIPYEGNEHLRGTTNNCDEYFKIWK